MVDHIGLRVKDLAAAVRFYKATLEPLGCQEAGRMSLSGLRNAGRSIDSMPPG